MDTQRFDEINKLLRYLVITSTTKAGSGHPTTCLSAIELMSVLFFNRHYHYDLSNPHNPKNDRVIFSKGHAAPLLYALYSVAGAISHDELMTLRDKNSRLEGHPTPEFAYAEAATGSLGQGLSIGLGIALAGAPGVYVLMGDGEVAEGNIWEAAAVAGHYKTSRLTGILDVNRLGQSDPTMLGWDTKTYRDRFTSFGWHAIVVENGHDVREVNKAYAEALTIKNKPQVIIAKTDKGHGISFLENKEGWHGKPVPAEQLEAALKELGKVDLQLTAEIEKP